MFARAGRLLRSDGQNAPVWRADYGTRLRDVAGTLALAAEVGSTAVNHNELSDRITRASARMSTQESAWTLLAAQALISNPETSGLLVDGQPVSGPFVRVLQGQAPGQGISISAADGSATDITLTTLGVPDVPPGPGGYGYTLERRHYSLHGAEIDPSDLAVGQRFVTVLRVLPHETVGARLMVDDPLPAGVEIDNPNLLRSGDLRGLDWLDLTAAQHAEFRSDRFLAAVDLRGSDPVTLAYVARAVSPGSFHHPAASVEDMYRPAYRARTGAGRVTIR
jgi:uncharacterized protein YfaS (alpha-2-macroglobulin family)